jgi:hypothetical protein
MAATKEVKQGSRVTIKNVGAIERLEFPVLPEGGVIVIQGEHGLGKSTAVSAIDALTGGREDKRLKPRDGSARGEISGCGVTITLGKRTSRTGELECRSIDGKLSVSDLVDPGIDNQMSADARRIRTLIQLARVNADRAAFAELFDSVEEFARVVPEELTQTDDPLAMADAIKKAIEKEARGLEGRSEAERALAASCAKAIEGIDLSAPHDSAALNAAYEQAIRDEQEIVTRKANAERHNASLAKARSEFSDTALAEAECRISLAAGKRMDAANELDSIVAKTTVATSLVVTLKEQLSQAEAALNELHRESRAAGQTVDRFKSEESDAIKARDAMLKTKASLEAAEAEVPPEDVVADRQQAVAFARAAVELGVAVRSAIQKEGDRQAHIKRATGLAQRADSLRGAAAGVDSVLSQQIQKIGGCPLLVDGGRLVLNTDRGREFFSDLSDGERWKIALDVAIDAVGETGLIGIPQVAWEGLNSRVRSLINDHARSRRATIVTAEVTEDEQLMVMSM